ncbi:MAG TPA: hypothetical protein VFL61_06245 [Gaiellaceae bacterium]|nr:hypothetical protein [Gaiellaceae bacterium]
MIALTGVPERHVGMDLIRVTPSGARAGDVTGIDEVVDEDLCCAFCDAEPLRDVAKTHAGVVGDTEQGAGVVGEERPTRTALSD